MDADEALKILQSSRTPIDQAVPPPVSGVYGWFLRAGCSIGSFSVPKNKPVYIGHSIDLKERSLGNHFESGATSRSTLRRSLGAILKDTLVLQAIPRDTSGSGKSFSNYRFDDAGEDRLTDWMRKTFDIGFCGSDIRKELEADLLAANKPLLNLRGCENTYAKEIKAKRKFCAREAAGLKSDTDDTSQNQRGHFPGASHIEHSVVEKCIHYMYHGCVSFEFDPKKATANLRKHGVSFAEAEPVFYDPLALTREDADAVVEQRFVTVGSGALGRILAVCWTERRPAIRVISARLATAHERKCYES